MIDQNIFLDHILQSIELIEDYTTDITKEDFLNTDFIQEAVIRRIKIIDGPIKTYHSILKINISKFHGKPLQMSGMLLKMKNVI